MLPRSPRGPGLLQGRAMISRRWGQLLGLLLVLVTVGLTALEVAGCYEAPRPLTPLACVGGQAGAIHTVVYRPVPHQPGERPWAAARVDAGIKASARSVVAELRGFVLMPLTRWEFTVDDTRLHQPGRAAPGFQFAFGVAFE